MMRCSNLVQEGLQGRVLRATCAGEKEEKQTRHNAKLRRGEQWETKKQITYRGRGSNDVRRRVRDRVAMPAAHIVAVGVCFRLSWPGLAFAAAVGAGGEISRRARAW